MPYPITRTLDAAAQLRTIRQQWGELLLAIETPPAPEWPPAQLSTHLARQQEADAELLDVVDRVPLSLRQHPAPANLDALDAAVRIEELVFDMADTLAAAVQRPPTRTPVNHPRRPTTWVVDPAEAADPRRWIIRSATDPGSRRHGLHWAAVWVEGRLLDEDTTPEQSSVTGRSVALFGLLPEYLRHETIRVAGQCERILLRALQLDARSTVIPGRPCPWCSGELTLHTAPDTAPSVTCSTVRTCTAPATLDHRGRREWTGAELLDLLGALATGREQQADSRAA